MKKYAYVLLSLFLMLGSCSEDDINPIQKDCKRILSELGTYQIKTLNETNGTTGAGVITGYYKNKSLVFATVETETTTERKLDQYYFDHENIECVKQIVFVYNKPNYYTQEMAQKNGDTAWFDEHKTKVKTTKFYFYEKRLIKWINQEGKEIQDNDRSYQYQRRSMLSDIEKLKKMLNG